MSISVTLLLLAALSPQSASQSASDDPLRGFDRVNVVVEKLSSGAGRCNVQQDSLQRSASRPLLDANIPVDPKALPYLYVTANVLPVGDDLCLAAIFISARTPAEGTLPYRKDKAYVDVLLWDTGGVLSGGPANFGQRVDAAVRDYTEEFVKKVRLANQK